MYGCPGVVLLICHGNHEGREEAAAETVYPEQGRGGTQGQMIDVFKHLEGRHRTEEWGFLCVRPEGRASTSGWAEVQRGGYQALEGVRRPRSVEYLCCIFSASGSCAVACWRCCRGGSMPGKELDLMTSKVSFNSLFLS